MSILDLVRQNVGPNEIQQIATQLGIDPATATRAVDAAIPGVVSGMAGHADGAAGAGAVEGLLGSGGGGLLGGLGSMLNAGGGAGGVLGNMLGQHEGTVSQSVQQTTGLDAGKAQQLLTILGPIVLAALARHRGLPNQ
ncbi:MAG TPA: DUF937 domain-containing protein [Gemmatimonadaceae bacterium]|jgi:hypothetical protein